MPNISSKSRHSNWSSIQVANLMGIIAPVVFVMLFTIEGGLRPGYNPTSMFVSELSLGSLGWMQIANFIITGMLIFLFGRGVAKQFTTGKGRQSRIHMPTDYRPEPYSLRAICYHPSVMFNQTSIHGIIHRHLRGSRFSLAPVTCFSFFSRFPNNPAWKIFSWWKLPLEFF